VSFRNGNPRVANETTAGDHGVGQTGAVTELGLCGRRQSRKEQWQEKPRDEDTVPEVLTVFNYSPLHRIPGAVPRVAFPGKSSGW